MFEEYSKYNFNKVSKFVESNRTAVNLRLNMLIVENLLDNLELIYKDEHNTSTTENLKTSILKNSLNNEDTIDKDSINKYLENLKTSIVKFSYNNITMDELEKEFFLKNKNKITAELRRKSKIVLKDSENNPIQNIDNPESDDLADKNYGYVQFNFGDHQTKKLELKGSRINSFIQNIFILPRDNTENEISKKYSFYRIGFFMRLSFLLIFIWIFPLYKYNFSKKAVYNNNIEKRIVNLPFFIFMLSWANALYFLLLRFYYFNAENSLNLMSAGTYFLSALLFGSISSYINSGITSSFIHNKMASRMFKSHNRFTLKKGLSVSLSAKIALTIFTLGVIPLFIAFYLPFYFYIGRMQVIMSAEEIDYIEFFYIFFPLVSTFIAGVIFFFPQLMSIIGVKKNIQKPINRLIEHMNKVSDGDFSTRASVFSADEIGKLRGHFNNMVEGLNEREKIRDTFGKFVSVEIAKKLMETGKVNLDGEELETTIMFTDIRNFTPFSEKMPPKDLINFLNHYFSYMCDPILKEKGVINKFIGDSIMAIFSPSFGLENHVDSALRAAIGLRKALIEFNKLGEYAEISQGVGLHTGNLVAGNVGTEQRMEYTVIGDIVNIASRIESQNKAFNTDILMSEDFYNKLSAKIKSEFNFSPFEPVNLKGKSEKITLYTVS